MATLNELLAEFQTTENNIPAQPEQDDQDRQRRELAARLLNEEAARQIRKAGGGRIVRTAQGRQRFRIAPPGGEQEEEKPKTFARQVEQEQAGATKRLLSKALERRAKKGKKQSIEDIFTAVGTGPVDKTGTPDVSEFVARAKKAGYSEDKIGKFLKETKKLDIPLTPTGEGALGTLAEMGRAPLRGIATGMEDIAKKVQWFTPSKFKGAEEYARRSAEAIRQTVEQNPQLFYQSTRDINRPWYSPTKAITGGFEMVARMAPGMAGGNLGVPLQFWGSMAQEKYDELSAKKPDLSEPDKVAFATAEGIVQGGLEWLQTKIPVAFLGKFIPKKARKDAIRRAAGVIRKSVPDVLKALGLSYLGELSTEVGQDLSSKELDYLSGLEEEGVSMEDLAESFKNNAGPMLVTTLLLGGLSGKMESERKKWIHDTLSAGKDKVSKEARAQAVKDVYDAVAQDDPDLADRWYSGVAGALGENAPIAIPTDDEAGYRFTTSHAEKLINELDKIGANPEEARAAVSELLSTRADMISPAAAKILRAKYGIPEQEAAAGPTAAEQPFAAPVTSEGGAVVPQEQPAPGAAVFPGMGTTGEIQYQGPPVPGEGIQPAPVAGSVEIDPDAGPLSAAAVQAIESGIAGPRAALPAPQAAIPAPEQGIQAKEQQAAGQPPQAGGNVASIIDHFVEAAKKEKPQTARELLSLPAPRTEERKPPEMPEGAGEIPGFVSSFTGGEQATEQPGQQEAKTDKLVRDLVETATGYGDFVKDLSGEATRYGQLSKNVGELATAKITGEEEGYDRQKKEGVLRGERVEQEKPGRPVQEQEAGRETVAAGRVLQKKDEVAINYPFEPYNERRYGDPWLGKIDFSGRRSSIKYAKRYGSASDGGTLDIRLNVGDIVIAGQKAKRGSRPGMPTTYYQVQRDGTLVKLKDRKEAKERWEENERRKAEEAKAGKGPVQRGGREVSEGAGRPEQGKQHGGAELPGRRGEEGATGKTEEVSEKPEERQESVKKEKEDVRVSEEEEERKQGKPEEAGQADVTGQRPGRPAEEGKDEQVLPGERGERDQEKEQTTPGYNGSDVNNVKSYKDLPGMKAVYARITRQIAADWAVYQITPEGYYKEAGLDKEYYSDGKVAVAADRPENKAMVERIKALGEKETIGFNKNTFPVNEIVNVLVDPFKEAANKDETKHTLSRVFRDDLVNLYAPDGTYETFDVNKIAYLLKNGYLPVIAYIRSGNNKTPVAVFKKDGIPSVLVMGLHLTEEEGGKDAEQEAKFGERYFIGRSDKGTVHGVGRRERGEGGRAKRRRRKEAEEGGKGAAGAVQQPGGSTTAGGGNVVGEEGSADNAVKDIVENDRPIAGEQGGNFVLTDDIAHIIRDRSQSERFRANVRAIEVLRTVEERRRPASTEEQFLMSQFSGWGGLVSIFSGSSKSAVKKQEELKKLLSEEEFIDAQGSTRNAFYTTPEIVRAIYAPLERITENVSKLSILEPSVGIGNFFGLMPESIRQRAGYVTGVELDSVTAALADKLYPGFRILHSGYEEVSFGKRQFDVAIGNPPFSEKTKASKHFDPRDEQGNKIKMSLHNFFVARMIDNTRPGGIVGVVVSHSLADAGSRKAKEWMVRHAEFIGGIRLPDTAFMKNTGTSVTTDILFFQKRMAPVSLDDVAGDSLDFLEREDLRDEETGGTIPVNRFFAKNQQYMLGKMTLKGTMYREGMPTLTATIPEDQLETRAREALLDQVIRNDVIDAFVNWREQHEDTLKELEAQEEGSVPVPDGIMVDSFFVHNGIIYKRVEDESGFKRSEPAKKYMPSKKAYADFTKKDVERITGMVGIRDALNEVLELDARKEDATEARKRLNELYDAFVKKNGYLSDTVNARLIAPDPMSARLKALEINYKKKITKTVAEKLGIDPAPASAEKAAIFNKNVIRPEKTVSVSNPNDALMISLANKGVVDMDYMVKVSGMSQEKLVGSLYGVSIFKDPYKGWVSAEEYLSGNVRSKLNEAEIALKRGDDLYKKNIEALKKVLPKDVPIERIFVKITSPWVHPRWIEDFAYEQLGRMVVRARTLQMQSGRIIKLDFSQVGERDSGSSAFSVDWVLERMLEKKPLVIREKTFDGSTTINSLETQRAGRLAEQIDREFSTWIKTSKYAQDAERIYNDSYNSIVPPKREGKHLTFPGMNSEITLRKHQVDAVWRSIVDGKILLDHVVGAGKTFTMIATAIEMKRMGLISKPLFAVPNHLVSQWAEDFSRLYPSANILVATKQTFEKHRRQEFVSRIATGNWDAIIMAHSQFRLFPANKQMMLEYIAEQVDLYEQSIRAAQADKMPRRLIKQLEDYRDKLKEQASTVAERQDEIMDIDTAGVDALFVDEHHEFKNLGIISKLNVQGMGTRKASQKAVDMFVKVRGIQKANGGRNTFFATGTPVSNTLAEMYTMLRYLDLDTLQSMGIAAFDDWVETFAQVQTKWGLDSTSVRMKQLTRLGDFNNMPELMALYGRYADVISMGKLKENAKREGLKWPVPRIKGGKPENIVVDRSEIQAAYMDEVVHRADNMPDDPSIDNFLKLTTDATKAALDMRILDPRAPDHPGSKVNVCAHYIKQIYDEWNDDKGTQLVFLDMSVPAKQLSKEREKYRELSEKAAAGDEKAAAQLAKYSEADIAALEGSGDFSVYDDLKKKLIGLGVPEKEIAFIHDASTDKKKEELFEMVRAGTVRVLIGSTMKMGVGMNVQERLVALHNLDAPWRPSDLEQRVGRIVRQGNKLYLRDPEGFEIRIVNYATEQTYDARRWQIIESKAIVVDSLRNFNLSGGERTIEDISVDAANAADMKAAASGDPRILEHVKLASDITELERMQEEHALKNYRLRRNLSAAKSRLDIDLDLKDEVVGKIDTTLDDQDRTDIILDGKKLSIPEQEEDESDKDYKKRVDEFWKNLVGNTRFEQVVDAAKEPVNRDRFLKLPIEMKGMAFYIRGEKSRFVGEQGHELTVYAVPASIANKNTNWKQMLVGHMLGSASYPMVFHKDSARITPKWLAGMVDKRIERYVLFKERFDRDIDNVRRDIDTLEKLIDQPFENEEELARKKERFEELSAELGGIEEIQTKYKPGDWQAMIEMYAGTEDGEYQAGHSVSEESSTYVTGDQKAQRVFYVHSDGKGRSVPHRNAAEVMRVIHAKVGSFVTRKDRINTAKDAAQLLWPLSKNAQESVMVLILDKDNKPLSVYRHTIGLTSSSMVSPGLIVAAAMNTKGAAKVWIAHNHPSGHATATEEDKTMAHTIDRLFNDNDAGVSLSGFLILTPEDKFSVYDENGNTSPKDIFRRGRKKFVEENEVAGKVPVFERMLKGKRRRTMTGVNITSTRQMEHESVRIAGKQSGIFLLDNRNNILEFVPINGDLMELRRDRKFMRRFYKALDTTPDVTTAVPYLVYDEEAEELQAFNAMSFVSMNGLRLLDIVINGRSGQETGKFDENIRSATMRKIQQFSSGRAPYSKSSAQAYRNTEDLKSNEKSPASEDEGEKVIIDIISKLRKSKVHRSSVTEKAKSLQEMIDLYRKAVDAIHDPHTSISEKQKFFAKFARSLPARPRAKLLSKLSQISRVKREATIRKRLLGALVYSNRVLEAYIRREITNRIRSYTKKRKRRKDRIARGFGARYEEQMKFIRQAIGMSIDESIASMAALQTELDEINNKLLFASDKATKDLKEKRQAVEDKMYILTVFGSLNDMSLDELINAKKSLEELIVGARIRWHEKMSVLDDLIEEKTKMVAEEILGREPDGSEIDITAKERRKQKERTSIGKIKEWLSSAENSIQSWEMFLDKLTSPSGAKMLGSNTVKYFASIVHAATRRYERYSMEETEYINKKAKEIFGAKDEAELKKKFAKLSKKVEGKVYLYTEAGRKAIPMSPFEAGYWYQLSLDYGNKNVSRTFKKMGITSRTLAQIQRLAGKEVIAWANFLTTEYYREMYKKVNKVYANIYGINLAYNPNYTPFVRDYSGDAREMTPEHSFLSDQAPATMKKGSLKERVNTDLAFKVVDMNSVLLRHISEMNHFRAWALPTKIVSGVFGSKYMKKLVRVQHGISMARTMRSFVADFMKSPNDTADDFKFLDRVRSKVTASLIGLNIIVFMKQLTSIPAYAAEIPVKSFAKHSAYAAMHPLEAARTVGFIMGRSTMLRARYKKGFERDVASAMSRSSSDVVAGAKDLISKMMAPARVGDMLAIIGGGYSVYMHHYEKAMKAGKSQEEAERIAIRQFEMATERSQQASGVKDLGWFQRGGPILKLFTMFMTTPASYSRIMFTAARHLKSDPARATKVLFIYGIVLPTLFRAVSDGFQYEDDDEFLKAMGSAILLGPFAGIPIIRTMVEGVINTVSGHRYIDNFTPVTQIAQSTKDMFGNLAKALTGGTKRIPASTYAARAAEDAAMLTGYGTGLPVRQLIRTGKGVYAVKEGETEKPIRKILGYSTKE